MRAAPLVPLFAVLVAACSPTREPIPLTPPQDVATAPVVRLAVPPANPGSAAPSSTPGPTVSAPSSGVPLALAAISVPAGAQYVCVVDRAGARQQTTIEFVPKVAELCRRHPEMGPCQYERNLCRNSGGRVYAANNVEITMQTEAEYDKKVMRVRFRAN